MWKVNRRQMPRDGKSSHCLWHGELKNKCAYHKNILLFTIFRGEMTPLWGDDIVTNGKLQNFSTIITATFGFDWLLSGL